MSKKTSKIDLKKGAMKRLAPFKPQEVEPDERKKVETWASGKYADYDLTNPSSFREKLPQIGGNARKRALHKLIGKTQSRVNPETGKVELLLHRGMSGAEHGRYVHGRKKANYDTHSSWTPNFDAALSFAGSNYESDKEYLEEQGQEPHTHVASAWISEDDIHHIPNQIGRARDDAKKPYKKAIYPEEHEVIIKPHTNNLRAVHEYGQTGETPVQSSGLSGLAPRGIRNSRFFGKSEKIDLKKGVLQRKWPFDLRKDIASKEKTALENWTLNNMKRGDFSSNPKIREKIPVANKNLLERAKHKLHRQTKVRRHPETGERQFLMYRGMGSHEFPSTFREGRVTHETKSSWTPNVWTAMQLARMHGNDLGVEGHAKALGAGNYEKARIVPAWISESALHHAPYGADKRLSSEKEYIVKPNHDSEVAHEDDIQEHLSHSFQQPTLPSRRMAQAQEKYKSKRITEGLQDWGVKKSENMKKTEKKRGTFIHGIGASEHLDSSGERIKVEGIDISSLTKDGVFNYEHKSESASQVVGKVLEAKKILTRSDCDNDHHKYFWDKIKVPFLYVAGELFDAVGHSGAQDVAAMLRYDDQGHDNKEAKNLINFSIEGSRLDKRGSNITKCIARKITITITPCNKAAGAEIKKDDNAKSSSDLGFIQSLMMEKNESSCQLMKGEVPFLHPKIKSEKKISTPAKKMVSEHKKLVNVLESPSHKDDKKEAKKQRKELKEYKSKIEKGDLVDIKSKKTISTQKDRRAKVKGPDSRDKKLYDKERRNFFDHQGRGNEKRRAEDRGADLLEDRLKGTYERRKHKKSKIEKGDLVDIKSKKTIDSKPERRNDSKKDRRSGWDRSKRLERDSERRDYKERRSFNFYPQHGIKSVKKAEKEPGAKPAFVRPGQKVKPEDVKEMGAGKFGLPAKKLIGKYDSNFRKALAAACGLTGPSAQVQGGAIKKDMATAFTNNATSLPLDNPKERQLKEKLGKSEIRKALNKLSTESFERFKDKSKLLKFVESNLPNLNKKEQMAIAKAVAYVREKKQEASLKSIGYGKE